MAFFKTKQEKEIMAQMKRDEQPMPEMNVKRLCGVSVWSAISGRARCTAFRIAWSPQPGHHLTSWSLLKSAGVYL